MPIITLNYEREKVLQYAKDWALKRNPAYYNFEALGGDCTNFVSQCIYAGAPAMNHTQQGWYYSDLRSRSPSWTGVPYLYDFLVKNKGIGPFAEESSLSALQVGDVVQLGRALGTFYHSLIVVGIEHGQLYVAAHTHDTQKRALSSYYFERARAIHILGYRKKV